MRMRKLWTILMGFLLLAVSGCSTPTSRMAKQPELVAALSPEEKQAILEERILIGFSRELVYLAKGDPERKKQRQTEQGIREVWVYEGIRSDTAEVIYTHPVRYRGQRVHLRPAFVNTQQAYPHTTVIFQDGRVTEFTVEQRR